MEAPEKIYLNPIQDALTDMLSEKTDGDIEYTRTDAFIEKVLKFLDENFFFNNVHHGIENGVFESEEEMFDYFINYVKGE